MEKKILGHFLSIVLGGAFGLLLGSYLYFVSTNVMLNIFITVFSLVIFLIVHVFIHELGHLFFGLLTNYKVKSIRFFPHTLLFREGRINYKKFSLQGTAGQCIMVPPPLDSKGRFPSKLYLIGGSLSNLITATIVLIFCLVTGVYTIVGYLLGFMNILPVGISDGMTLKTISKSKISLKQFYSQFVIYCETTDGVLLRDIPASLLVINEKQDAADYMNNYIILIVYARALDDFDFEKAKNIIEPLWLEKEKLIPIYEREVGQKMLYLLSLKGDNEAERILMEPYMTKFSKVKMMGAKRALAAYELFIKKDPVRALEYCCKGKAMYNVSANQGDAELELRLLLWLEEQANRQLK